MQLLLFYFFSALAVLSALAVIFAKRPARALLSLIVTMFCLSVLYLLLGAPFVAMVHLIVYAGAVLVLFLFVIMLQGIAASEIPFWQRFQANHLILALITAILILGGFFAVLKRVVSAQPAAVDGSIQSIGRLLFHDYLIPFELTSFLLLLGVLAAVSLAKGEEA